MIKFENARPDTSPSLEEKTALGKKLATDTAEVDGSGARKRSTPAARPAKDPKAPPSDMLDL
ncbi:hypothetical protein J2858_002233 [Neorhizobium galegae]|uniref:hypothetical protein n=1 Tax=Neorhizobium galegae TaxID=399 RepID=UPI001AE3D64F|nr:hypothetical protein [Neorhizobium galegae]MBP2549310.1 hypothetical protein [Neorhizobium galegae]